VICPLCAQEKSSVLWKKLHQREYWRCHFCDFIFVPSIFHLSFEEEKNRYDRHKNISSDPAYQNFFMAFADEMGRLPLEAGSEVLDFGSGVDSALKPVLESKGFKVSEFDPFYKNDEALLKSRYPLVTCTEVLEHLRDPKQSIRQMLASLLPGGYLGTMTRLYLPEMQFEGWHYSRDPTHIGFWTPGAFSFLAQYFQLEILACEPKFQILRLSSTAERV
jgi:hypothetical protein